MNMSRDSDFLKMNDVHYLKKQVGLLKRQVKELS